MSEYWEGWGRFFVIGVMFVYVSRAILDCKIPVIVGHTVLCRELNSVNA